jgi:hypothetical protein
MTQITADEFMKEYAARSNVTVEFLEENGRRVFPCKCGDSTCEGWAVLGKDQWSDPMTLWMATRVGEVPKS